MTSNPIKKYPTIACCGLDCGLCPTYYTKGPSQCPGCCGPDFANHHPSCSIITCCVKNKNFETCAECKEFPCSKIKNWDAMDSFISHKRSLSNLREIQKSGIEEFLKQQTKRIKILKSLLDNYNEGRSKSFYCIASALLPINSLKSAMETITQKIKEKKIKSDDIKSKSKVIRDFLNKVASKQGIELKLKKK